MIISYPPSLTFLGDSRMQSREICVFPVYLLRGHVPCNRFSFLLHRPRIGASNSSASSFFLSFLFPLFTRIETRTTFSRSFTREGRRVYVFFYEEWMDRLWIMKTECCPFRRFQRFSMRGKQISSGVCGTFIRGLKRRKYRYFENVFRLEERLV